MKGNRPPQTCRRADYMGTRALRCREPFRLELFDDRAGKTVLAGEIRGVRGRPFDTAGRGRLYLSYWGVQLEAIIFTLSTFSVGETAAEAVGFCSFGETCSMVPVTSTL